MNSEPTPGALPFLRKLASLHPLTDADVAAASALCVNVQTFKRHQRLDQAGNQPWSGLILLEGWAAQQEESFTGKRCITTFFLPGDSYGVGPEPLKTQNASVRALSYCKVATVSQAILRRLEFHSPSFQALWHTKALADLAIARRWLVMKNSVTAFEALGHLIAELHARSLITEPASTAFFNLRATQDDLGAALGLTSVHVNRMLQKWRADGVLGGDRGRIVVNDVAELRRVSGFDPNYLSGFSG